MRLTLSLIGEAAQQAVRSEHVFEIAGGTIGRDPRSDWVIADPTLRVSSRHAQISHNGLGFVLTDTSTNGVYVNQTASPLGRGNTTILKDGDLLFFAHVGCRVTVAQPAAAKVAAPTAPIIPDDMMLAVAPNPEPSINLAARVMPHRNGGAPSQPLAAEQRAAPAVSPLMRRLAGQQASPHATPVPGTNGGNVGTGSSASAALRPRLGAAPPQAAPPVPSGAAIPADFDPLQGLLSQAAAPANPSMTAVVAPRPITASRGDDGLAPAVAPPSPEPAAVQDPASFKPAGSAPTAVGPAAPLPISAATAPDFAALGDPVASTTPTTAAQASPLPASRENLALTNTRQRLMAKLRSTAVTPAQPPRPNLQAFWAGLGVRDGAPGLVDGHAVLGRAGAGLRAAFAALHQLNHSEGVRADGDNLRRHQPDLDKLLVAGLTGEAPPLTQQVADLSASLDALHRERDDGWIDVLRDVMAAIEPAQFLLTARKDLAEQDETAHKAAAWEALAARLAQLRVDMDSVLPTAPEKPAAAARQDDGVDIAEPPPPGSDLGAPDLAEPPRAGGAAHA